MGNIAKKYGKLILIISVVILMVSIVLCSKLKMVTNFTSLIPEDNPVLMAQIDFEETFGLGERVYVVVEGKRDVRYQAMDDLVNHIDKSDKILNYYIGSKSEDGTTEYLDSPDDTMTMLIVEPTINTENFAKSRKEFFDYLNKIIEDVNSNYKKDELSIGFTGGNFVQDDESDRVMEEGIFGTLSLTLVAIMICVVISFRRIKLPLFLGYPLLFGVVVTAAIGFIIFREFNVFSVFFAVVLLGLGIDFGIHLLARYFEELRSKKTVIEAITNALKTTGVSILIGALTTAGAFYSFAFTDFKGFQQMGILAGTGILILALSMLILVPCVIPFIKSKNITPIIKTIPQRKVYVTVAVTVVTLIIIVIGMLGVQSQKYIYNIQETYPKEMSSTKWQEKLEKAYKTTISDLTVLVNSESEVRALKDALENRSDIEKIESIFSYVPKGVSLEKALSQLPKVLVKQYINGDTYRVDIKSTGDIWDTAYYEDLSKTIYDITGQEVIGFSAMMIELGKIVIDDVIGVSVICLLIIVGLLILVFKNPKDVILAFLPMIVSTITTYGLMYQLKIPLNIISIVAFPMIIGISIDSSIHLVHRLKHDPKGVSETIKAIKLTGMTTIIGFGALATINHRGLASLGATVALGLFVSVLINISLFSILSNKVVKKNNDIR